MHFFHPTPLDIVEQFIASTTKGKYFSRVLEPCVGNGALLTSLENNFDKLTIIDIDIDKLKGFLNENYNVYAGDFLDIQLNEKFDLILCNPPFNNKSISGLSIEEQFLSKCLNLLEHEGYGIFILPSSIVNGTKAKKIRKYLIKYFTILSINILPKNSFSKIESHFYIITLQNIKPLKKYTFATNMGEMCIQDILINDHLPLNPKILFNSKNYNKILNSFPSFNLSKEPIFRGTTQKNQSQVHTTHFSSHFFCPKNVLPYIKNGKTIKKYDLIYKRVGRNCHNSFSIYLGQESLVVSDCVVVIPSNSDNYFNNLILLLNIRLSILLGASCNFMIDGSGANYIPLVKLKNTEFINFKDFLSKKTIEDYYFLLLENNINNLLIFENRLKSTILTKIGTK
ncbi:SAM-dependent methyltransferase [Acinetobacter sp. ANC 4204]|uniref:methyltransferase n=1 Tax=Acinetobacter sp. ANC 4204 TaxID=1977884 RepID=UPI000A32EA13|nr:class I SAM-dependent methyltransferase [Acinetobacter sp. ANC 4204]OTG57870.1 SAM-dependent methyltransferase [Acinetobacter sp. ANC 4204]